MKVKSLAWDSEFFQKNIGLLEIYENDGSKLEIENFDLVYLKTKTKKPILIRGYTKSYQELKLTFTKTLSSNFSTQIENIKVLDINRINPEQLYNLAYESGKYSRFKLDTKFKTTEFYRFYDSWIDNSINKTFADDILIYELERRILGFISYKINNTTAKVGLFAVSEKKQGKGIGAKLLNALERHLFQAGVLKLDIPTQEENSQACKFYKKAGYTISNQVFVNHYWKS